MSDDPPIPPTSLPVELVDTVNESTPEQLRDVATYAEELAELKERETHLKEDPDQDEAEDRPEDLPPKAFKATLYLVCSHNHNDRSPAFVASGESRDIYHAESVRE